MVAFGLVLLQSLGLFQLDAPGRGPRIPQSTRQMALYPLPAVYLPGSECMVRNIEPRNKKMCQEQSEFVVACVNADRSACASIGSVLRIDNVRPARRDNSGQVLATTEESNVLEVRCTVVGRVRIVACDNLEAWRDRSRAEYLVADVADYDDEVEESAAPDDVSPPDEDEVAGAIYKLTDALLESAPADGSEPGLDVDAAVASLEYAAELCADHRWWDALDVWQMHCATRLAAVAALHRVERNEFVIDAKMRQGGMLEIPVKEWTLDIADRVKLADLDARAADAAAQMGLDDASSFQEMLETRLPAERAALLLRGVEREAERLARRASLARSLEI